MTNMRKDTTKTTAAASEKNLFEELRQSLALSGIIFDLAVLNAFIRTEKHQHAHHHDHDHDQQQQEQQQRTVVEDKKEDDVEEEGTTEDNNKDDTNCSIINVIQIPQLLQVPPVLQQQQNQKPLQNPDFLDDLPKSALEVANWLDSNLDVLKSCKKKTYEDFDKEALLRIADYQAKKEKLALKQQKQQTTKNKEASNNNNENSSNNTKQEEVEELDSTDLLSAEKYLLHRQKMEQKETKKKEQQQSSSDKNNDNNNTDDDYSIRSFFNSDTYNDAIGEGILEYFDSKFAFCGFHSEIVYAISSNPKAKRITVSFRGSIESKDWKTNATVAPKRVDFNSSFVEVKRNNSHGSNSFDDYVNMVNKENNDNDTKEEEEEEQVSEKNHNNNNDNNGDNKKNKEINSSSGDNLISATTAAVVVAAAAEEEEATTTDSNIPTPAQAVLEKIPQRPSAIRLVPPFLDRSRQHQHQKKEEYIKNSIPNPNKECLDAFNNVHVHSGFYDYLFTLGTKHTEDSTELQELQKQQCHELQEQQSSVSDSSMNKGSAVATPPIPPTTSDTGGGGGDSNCVCDCDDAAAVEHIRITKFAKIMTEVTTLLERYDDYELYFTGHSLGAALATLCATAASMSDDVRHPIKLITFASPHVGQSDFVDAFKYLERTNRIRHIRVTNDDDIVPRGLGGFGYRHCGINVQFNQSKNKVAQWLIDGARVIPDMITGHDHHTNKLYDIQQSNLSSEKFKFITKNLGINYKWFVGIPHEFPVYLERLDESSKDLAKLTISELYNDKRLTDYPS